jgi:hypothetical protein
MKLTFKMFNTYQRTVLIVQENCRQPWAYYQLADDQQLNLLQRIDYLINAVAAFCLGLAGQCSFLVSQILWQQASLGRSLKITNVTGHFKKLPKDILRYTMSWMTYQEQGRFKQVCKSTNSHVEINFNGEPLMPQILKGALPYKDIKSITLSSKFYFDEVTMDPRRWSKMFPNLTTITTRVLLRESDSEALKKANPKLLRINFVDSNQKALVKNQNPSHKCKMIPASKFESIMIDRRACIL